MANYKSTPPFLLANNRKLILALLVLGTALLLLLSWINQQHLVDCVALNGIESLKFAGGDDYVVQVLAQWMERGKLSHAWWNTVLDLPFIILYTLLISFWMVVAASYFENENHKKTAKTAMVLSWLVFLAGILDVWENSALLNWINLYLENPQLKVALFFKPWLIAFVVFAKLSILLLCFTMGLLWFSSRFEHLLKTIWQSRVSLIICGIIYIFFWKTAQGRDLLISINERPFHVIFLVILSAIIAAFCWFIPRYYFDENLAKLHVDKSTPLTSPIWGTHYEHEQRNPYLVILPRLLGVLSILLLYGAIRNVLRDCNCYFIDKGFHIVPEIQVLLLISTFAVLSRWNGQSFFNKLSDAWKDFFLRLSLVFVVLLLLLLGSLQFLEPDSPLNRPKGLDILSYGLLLMGMAFFIFVSIRRRLKGLTFRSYRIQYISNNVVIAKLMFVAVCSCLLLFLAANSFSPEISRFFGGAAITFCAILSYLSLFAVISIRRRNTNAHFLTTFIILAGIAFFVTNNMDNNYHDVDTINKACVDCQPLSLESYFQKWVAARESDILAQEEDYPIFLVATNGGGSRAAYWTSMINARLTESTNGEYAKHLFAMSGASGGSIGSSVFVSLLYDRLRNPKQDWPLTEQIDSLYMGADFLSPSLTYLLGKGIWQCFIPGDLQSLNDRSEQVMIDYRTRLNENGKVTENTFDLPFRDLWYNADYSEINPWLPLYFANTTRVEAGRRSIGSPVLLDKQFVDAVDILDLEDDQTLSFGTAAFLTNRFPLVNAAGKLQEKGHFVDAGYFDNTGAITAIEIINRLKALQRLEASGSDSLLYAKLAFHLIKIDNDEYTSGILTMDRLNISCSHLNEIPEFLSPVNAALGALLEGHVRYSDGRAKTEVGADHFYHFWLPYPLTDDVLSKFCACSSAFPCEDTGECEQWNKQFPKPDACFGLPPLGRYLSVHAIERMKLQLDSFAPLQEGPFREVVETFQPPVFQ